MQQIQSTNGVRVALHELGGAGPLLLVAHATGFHARAYGPMAARLAETFRVVGADLRGHGDTNAPDDGDFHWDGFADDVEAVIAALDPRGPIFGFGHSKGGAALVLTELRHPGTFSSIYLYEPIMFPSDAAQNLTTENPLAASARRRRERFDSYDAAIENFGSKPPLDVFAPEALDAYVRHGFEDDPADGVLIKCRGEHEARTFEMSTSHQAFDRLGEISIPIRVAAGHDGGHPAVAAPVIADRLLHGTLERFDDLGHFGPFQAPERIAASVAAYLKETR